MLLKHGMGFGIATTFSQRENSYFTYDDVLKLVYEGRF